MFHKVIIKFHKGIVMFHNGIVLHCISYWNCNVS